LTGRIENLFRKTRSLLVRLLIFLARPLEDDRTAIWSIPKPLGAVYFVVFAGASAWTIQEIVQVKSSKHCGFVWTITLIGESDCLTTWNTLVRETATEFAPVGIGIAIGTLITMHGVAAIMAIYQLLTNAFTKPVIERHTAKGRTEGRTEGRAEGRAEANRQWQEWNQRRMDAEANNRPFDEPPPSQP
jgi:hypothetical protein